MAHTAEKTTTPLPQPDLTASIGRNTLFGIVCNLAQVGTRVVTVPIVIHHLGLGGYGIWNIIMMTATYMRFGSVGVKTAFQKYVAEATGDGDYQRASRLLSTGCAVMAAFSIAGLIPVSLYATAIAKAAGVPAEFLVSAAGAISLLAIMMVLANVGAAFEAIVMGGHRIDLVRKFGTVLAIAEAACILVALRLGYGLFAMAAIMGTSELVYVVCCYIASRRVVPQVRVTPENVTKDVLYELFRFAGGYQLVNLLEVLYVSLLPFAILRQFGAAAAGVFAVVTRVATSAGVLQEAFLPSILSGGAMVYASGSMERMQSLVLKAFKVTIVLSLFPLGYIALFGTTIAYAWTGQVDAFFPAAFAFVCSRGIFQSFSLLALVLYKVTGKALLDNVRQILRIVFLLGVVLYARELGFLGVLAGMAVTELAGMVFMLVAVASTFRFSFRPIMLDLARVAGATLLILGAGFAASHIPLPGDAGGRLLATLKLVEISMACLLVTWPLTVYTGSVTAGEKTALIRVLFPGRRADRSLIQNAT